MLVLLFFGLWMIWNSVIAVLIPQIQEMVAGMGVVLIMVLGIILMLSSIKIRMIIPFSKIAQKIVKGTITIVKAFVYSIYVLSKKIYNTIFSKLFNYLENKGVNRILAKTIAILVALIVVI